MPSYINLERSKYGGRPAEFFHFYRGADDWRMTPVPMTVILADGQIFSPQAGLKRGDIEGGTADNPGQLSIDMPTNTALIQAVLNGRSDAPINLKLYQYHKSANTDTKIIFWGEVVAYDEQRDVTSIRCNPTLAMADMQLPRGVYQRETCDWNTYDPHTCKVNPAAFTFTGPVADIDGLAVTVTGAAAFGGDDPEFFSLGAITKGTRRGEIEKQQGDVIILRHPISGLIVGDTVSIIAGDDRTPQTCLNKFDNILRHFSFNKMPKNNPSYGQGVREF